MQFAELDSGTCALMMTMRFTPPHDAVADVSVDRSEVGSWPVFTVHPATGPGRGRLLYLHGGGHITQMSASHWTFVAALVRATGWTAVVPIFPLVPEATHRDVLAYAVSGLGGAVADDAVVQRCRVHHDERQHRRERRRH